jgi:hypothetical protein
MQNNERYISVFDKKDDFVFEVNIDSIDVEILKKIFTPYEEDPDFVMSYPIGEMNANILKKYIDFEFDFSEYSYDIITYAKK